MLADEVFGPVLVGSRVDGVDGVFDLFRLDGPELEAPVLIGVGAA